MNFATAIIAASAFILATPAHAGLARELIGKPVIVVSQQGDDAFLVWVSDQGVWPRARVMTVYLGTNADDPETLAKAKEFIKAVTPPEDCFTFGEYLPGLKWLFQFETICSPKAADEPDSLDQSR